MNRRNFFKNLSAAAIGVVVAPAVVIKAIKITPLFDVEKLNPHIPKYPPVFSDDVIDALYRKYGNPGMNAVQLFHRMGRSVI